MENNIFFLVNILSDNNFDMKVDEVFDRKVTAMLDKDIDDNSSIISSDNPFYIELNGFSDPTELDGYLEICLDKFKKIAADTRLDKNRLLQTEISQGVLSIRTDLVQIKGIKPQGRTLDPSFRCRASGN